VRPRLELVSRTLRRATAVIGGKQRIEAYIARLQLAAQERQRLTRLVPQIHRTEEPAVQTAGGISAAFARARECTVSLSRRVMPESSLPLLHDVAREFLLTDHASFGPEAPRWFSAVIPRCYFEARKPFPDVLQPGVGKVRLCRPGAQSRSRTRRLVHSQLRRPASFTVVTAKRMDHDGGLCCRRPDPAVSGDPEEPLDPADERRIGAKYLDLRQLAAFHFAALRSDGRSVSPSRLNLDNRFLRASTPTRHA